MSQRGRPPKTEGALTPAQRKAAQRERERAALHAEGADVGELSTTALVEGLPGLIAGKHAGALGVTLVELGRRGGVVVTLKTESERPAVKRPTVREAIIAFRKLGVPAYTRVDGADPDLLDAPDQYPAEEQPNATRLSIDELVEERMKEPFEYGDLVDGLMEQPQNQGKARRDIEREVMRRAVCFGG